MLLNAALSTVAPVFTEGADSVLTDAELRAADRHRCAQQLPTYPRRLARSSIQQAKPFDSIHCRPNRMSAAESSCPTGNYLGLERSAIPTQRCDEPTKPLWQNGRIIDTGKQQDRLAAQVRRLKIRQCDLRRA